VSTWLFSTPAFTGGASLLDLSIDAWTASIDTNLYGLLNGIKVFLPLRRAQDDGSLLATSSAAGMHGTSYNTAAYATTKNAQLTIMECLYGQLRDVNAKVHVGIVLPPLTRTNLAGDDPAIWEHIQEGMTRAGRLAAVIEPEEFAHVLVEVLLARRFLIETSEDQNQRFYGGRKPGAELRAKLVQAKAGALINHTEPHPYLW
jgi:NAD(P)-dependent dehydrogenase (short-subunit alcohol dehydrogenase family)